MSVYAVQSNRSDEVSGAWAWASFGYLKPAVIVLSLAVTSSDVSLDAAYPGVEPQFRLLSEVTANEQEMSGLLRAAAFAEVRELISAMGDLPEGDDFYVRPATVGASNEVLEILQSLPIAPPKVFAQDDEAVVFEWRDDVGTRYITVDDSAASLLLSTGTEYIEYGHINLADLTPIPFQKFLQPAGISNATSRAG